MAEEMAQEQSTQGQQQRQPTQSAAPTQPHEMQQEEMSKVKDGDTYTDDKGQRWQYSVMNFSIVPEDVKDEMVDAFSATETEEGKDPDYDENLSRGLDIALSILREEEDGENEEDTGVANDSAIDILMGACDDVLGGETIAEDGAYTDPKEMTMKRQGYAVPRYEDIPPYLRAQKGKHIKQLPDGSWWRPSYQTDAQKKAMENARQTHRRNVATSYKDCKAKNPARCRYHGAAFLTSSLGDVLASHGIQSDKFGVIMDDPVMKADKDSPLSYRVIFSCPPNTDPELKKQVFRDFFQKNPSIIFKAEQKFGSAKSNDIFEVKPEDVDDMPEDAPTFEEENERRDSPAEASFNERAKVKGAVSYTKFDTLTHEQFFNMLSERPQNIVALNDDMMRYTQQFPEYLPEGISAEEVKEAFDAFKKANAEKQGLRAFLTQGMIVDKAQALKDAAESGLDKEGKAYYEAAERVYKLASDVFNGVQDALEAEFNAVRRGFDRLPPLKKVMGEVGKKKGTTTVYFGSAFRQAGGTFPRQVGNPAVNDILSAEVANFQKRWECAENAARSFIWTGCEQREPMLVAFGLAMYRRSLESLQKCANDIGVMQDKILAASNDKWKAKYGFSEKGQKKSGQGAGAVDKGKKEVSEAKKSDEEVISNTPPSSIENQENADKKKNKKPKKDKKAKKGEDDKDKTEKNTPAEGIETSTKETDTDTDATQQDDRTDETTENATGVEETEEEDTQRVEEPIEPPSYIRDIEMVKEPTVESATAINKKMEEVAKRIRGLEFFINADNSKMADVKAAEREMDGIKMHIDKMIEDATKNGYKLAYGEANEWGIPSNLHIESITDKGGKTTNIPYEQPTWRQMILPDTKSSGGVKRQTPKKSTADYAQMFEDINDAFGETSSGETLKEMITVNDYFVKPVKTKSGQTAYLLAKRDNNSPSGVDMSAPRYNLETAFKSRNLGDPNNPDAFNDFIEALRQFVKKSQEV